MIVSAARDPYSWGPQFQTVRGVNKSFRPTVPEWEPVAARLVSLKKTDGFSRKPPITFAISNIKANKAHDIASASLKPFSPPTQPDPSPAKPTRRETAQETFQGRPTSQRLACLDGLVGLFQCSHLSRRSK